MKACEANLKPNEDSVCSQTRQSSKQFSAKREDMSMYLCAQLWQQVEGGAVSSLTVSRQLLHWYHQDYGLSLNEKKKKKAGGERNNQ